MRTLLCYLGAIGDTGSSLAAGSILVSYNLRFNLIREFAQNPKICHYVDLPLQHANNDVLVRMGRGSVAGTQRRLIDRLRSACLMWP